MGRLILKKKNKSQKQELTKFGSDSYMDDNKLPFWLKNIVNDDMRFKQTKFGILLIVKKNCYAVCIWCKEQISIKCKEDKGFRSFTEFYHRSGRVCLGNKTQSSFNLFRLSEVPEDTIPIDQLDHKQDLDSYNILKDSNFRSLIDYKHSITFNDLNEESKIILKRLCFDDEIGVYIQRLNKVLRSESLSRIEKFMNDQLIEMSCQNKMQLIPKPAMIQALILIGLLSNDTISRIRSSKRYPNMLCYAKPDDQVIIHNCIYIFFVGIAREIKLKKVKNGKELLCFLYIKCGRAKDEFDRSNKHFNNFLDRCSPKDCTSPGKGLCINGCRETFYRFRKAKILSAPTENDKAAEKKFHDQLKSDHQNLYPIASFKLGIPEPNKNNASTEIFRIPIKISLELLSGHPLKSDILEIINSNDASKMFEEKFKDEKFHDHFLDFVQTTIESNKTLMWYLYSSSLSEHGTFNVFNIRQVGDMSNITNKSRLYLHKTKITSLEKEVEVKTQELEVKTQELEVKTQELEVKTQELEENEQQFDSLYSDLEIVLEQRDRFESMLKAYNVSEDTIKEIRKEVAEKHRKNSSPSEDEPPIEENMANLKI